MTQINELAAALVKAQGEMKAPHFDAQVNTGRFNYRYATLNAVRDATIAALHANGLAIVQAPDTQDGRFGIRTVLMHSSGESIEGFYPIPDNPDPQKIGSAITYAKRYSWASMCGVVADDDDDAQSAREPAQQQSAPPAQDTAAKPNGSDRAPGADEGAEAEERADNLVSDATKAILGCPSVGRIDKMLAAEQDRLTDLRAMFPEKHERLMTVVKNRKMVLEAAKTPGADVGEDAGHM